MRKITQKYYIADTDIGRGVFAKRPIKNGEAILKFSGPIITTADKITEEKTLHGYPLQIRNNKYIDIKSPGVLVNHSCNPNAGIKNDKILIAIKNICIDEEIRYDYSTTMDEDDWTMKCKCHQKNCRKIVKDFKYLPKTMREKYLKLGIVQKFIARKYQNQTNRNFLTETFI
jgi:hypothetical protein